MSNVRTATTAHGDVEYETVDCDSCDSEVRKEDAHKWIMLEDVRTDRSRFDYHRWEAHEYITGWACPYCYDEGPIEYPRTERASRAIGDFWRALLSDPDLDMMRFGGVLYIVLSGAFLVAILLGVLAA